jgi:hypothetical protein
LGGGELLARGGFAFFGIANTHHGGAEIGFELLVFRREEIEGGLGAREFRFRVVEFGRKAAGFRASLGELFPDGFFVGFRGGFDDHRIGVGGEEKRGTERGETDETEDEEANRGMLHGGGGGVSRCSFDTIPGRGCEKPPPARGAARTGSR